MKRPEEYKIFFLMFYLGFIISSCNPNPFERVPSTIVEVTVQDFHTHQSLPNATVFLKSYIPDSYGSGNFEMKAISDADGFARFKFFAEKHRSYLVWTLKDSYLDYYEDYRFHFPGSSHSVESPYDSQVLTGKRNNFVQKLKSKASLRINITNQTPFNNNDWIAVYYPQEDLIYYSVDSEVYSGTDVNENFTTKVIGNQKYAITWEVKKNNITNQYSDSVFCYPGTTMYDINY